jgi:folate-dependent phosphoribosylglycinamide formyltransferase PurN
LRVVAIVTEGFANQQMCLEVAAKHELLAVYHPAGQAKSLRRSLDTFKRWQKSRGAVYVALHKLGRGGGPLGWSRGGRLWAAEQRHFGHCHAEYQRLIAPKARVVDDVNSPAFAEEIRRLAPDAVICSGGPVYRAPLIRAAKLMLNYHTGISPVYNGSDTNIWAFINGHPQLCGGTLMVMGEAVDGGDILAHHFCGVEPGDDPADAFCRAIAGGAALYNEFLSDIEAGRSYRSVPQTKPFFYYRNLDWSLYQSLQAARLMAGASKASKRVPADTVRYWQLETAEAARRRLHDEITRRVLIDE